MRFQFGEIKIRADSARQQFPGVMEEVQRKIENSARYRSAIYQNVLLIQVPAAWARDHRRGFVFELIMLAVLFQGDVAAHCITQIDLAVNQIFPSGAIGILKVGHESGSAAIERVDDHLAISGPSDFHAAVEQILRKRRDTPCAIADIFCLDQKIRQLASIKFFLASVTFG